MTVRNSFLKVVQVFNMKINMIIINIIKELRGKKLKILNC